MAKKSVSKPSKAVTSRRQMVPPVNVVNLMNAIGGTRTAAKLGVSTTLLYKAKNENAINQVVEVAAAHALEHLGKPELPALAPATIQAPGYARGGDMAFFVTIAADKADMFQRMASAMGAAVVAA